MSTIQEFLAETTRTTAKQLLDAALLIPEDKRSWSPLDKGRSAADQVAECALINRNCLEIIRTHVWSINDMEAWMQEKRKLAESWDETAARLTTSAAELAGAILALSDDCLAIEIALPMGANTLQFVIAYPQWNMSYHHGQVTYIQLLAA